jgi:hypothetical protein
MKEQVESAIAALKQTLSTAEQLAASVADTTAQFEKVVDAKVAELAALVPAEAPAEVPVEHSTEVNDPGHTA